MARTEPNLKATENIFTLQELQVLHNYHKVKNKRLLKNKSKTDPPDKDNPDTISTIYQVVIQIAKLSGFLARKRDVFPGVKTIWKGLMKLSHMEEYHEVVFVGRG